MARYCRINLNKTYGHYKPITQFELLTNPPISELKEIFRKYCAYKDFEGVMPIFDSQYLDPYNDVLGYYDNSKLVAFSLCRRYDDDNVESIQFAWDYSNADLRLGIKSIENECAYYQSLGFKYLYLGISEPYKQRFIGYEELGINDV